MVAVWGGRYVFLVLVTYLATVWGIYVPETETGPSITVEPVCPEACQCTSRNTSNCVFKHDSYYPHLLLPWRLTRLQILGDETYPESLTGFYLPSLSSVIYKERESLGEESVSNLFTDVIELHVNHVPFQQLTSPDFENLQNLTALNLAYNGITAIQKGSFSKLLKLRVLNLEGNKISALQDEIFSGLKELKNLTLSENNIHTISSKTFEGLFNLQNLHIRNNELEQIDSFINTLSILNILDISGNKLSYILPKTVPFLSTFGEISLYDNPFYCSCVTKPLISALRSHPSTFKYDLICDGPSNVQGVRLEDLDVDLLECDKADVMSLYSPPFGYNHRDLTLKCDVKGTPPLGLYWLTPWGDKFTLPETKQLFPNETKGAFSDKDYQGINLILKSHVYVTQSGNLQIDTFRGHLAGNFTCVPINLLGHSSNKSVTVIPVTKMVSTYLTSIVIGSICAGSTLVLAIFIGAVRWFVSKCMHSSGCKCCCCRSDEYDVTDDKYKIEDDSLTVEITYAATDECHTMDDTDYDPDSSPPTVPVNSPQIRKSPEKCHTPAIDPNEADKNPSHIWDQLEEVRARLRCGAERKIEKVRSHVRSITDSGSLKIRNIKDASSLKIQSIRETGSNAASKVKKNVAKNVASGMEQVKYGVQSIKEFCGTGDMGPGTVSMVSVCTDVDTKEQFKIVKSHTFV